MRRAVSALFLTLLACLPAVPQQLITPFSLPDITGTGSAVVLSTSGTARFCQLVAPSTNTNVIRWGDSAITSSRGSEMAPNSGQFIPPGPATGNSGTLTNYYFNLNTVYVLVQSGDSLTVTCFK